MSFLRHILDLLNYMNMYKKQIIPNLKSKNSNHNDILSFQTFNMLKYRTKRIAVWCQVDYVTFTLINLILFIKELEQDILNWLELIKIYTHETKSSIISPNERLIMWFKLFSVQAGSGSGCSMKKLKRDEESNSVTSYLISHNLVHFKYSIHLHPCQMRYSALFKLISFNIACLHGAKLTCRQSTPVNREEHLTYYKKQNMPKEAQNYWATEVT